MVKIRRLQRQREGAALLNAIEEDGTTTFKGFGIEVDDIR